MIFVTWNPEKIWHESFTDCPPHLSFVATVPWEIQQSFSTVLFIHTSDYLCYLTKKTIYNPLAHPTWKCHHTNFWIAKLFHLTGGFLHSFKRWRLWKEPVVVCHQWLWKEPVVMCSSWYVRQTVSQQVFRVTTLCMDACFQSFLTLFSHVVHHAVLKFSERRNQPLLQASTPPYQYTHSSCRVLQMQYFGYADNRKH